MGFFLQINAGIAEVLNMLRDKIIKAFVNDAEKPSIKADLQRMIQFVEKLNELDTAGVTPLLHMSDGINVLREDEIKGSIKRAEGLKNAPLQDGVFFKVPKVIKK